MLRLCPKCNSIMEYSARSGCMICPKCNRDKHTFWEVKDVKRIK